MRVCVSPLLNRLLRQHVSVAIRRPTTLCPLLRRGQLACRGVHSEWRRSRSLVARRLALGCYQLPWTRELCGKGPSSRSEEFDDEVRGNTHPVIGMTRARHQAHPSHMPSAPAIDASVWFKYRANRGVRDFCVAARDSSAASRCAAVSWAMVSPRRRVAYIPLLLRAQDKHRK